jgi:hypothetical protein
MTALDIAEDLIVRGITTLSGTLTFTGPATLSATTTPAANTYFGIKDSLDLTGTSTAKGATQNLVAYYTNTGADLIVDWVGVDITTQLTNFEASFQCGTTTWVGGVEGVSLTATTSASIIATSTAATTFDTHDAGYFTFDTNDNPGSGFLMNTYGYASSSAFILGHNEVLFCTWTPYGATSSDSFSTSLGFTGAGNMIANVRARGN